jgi:beta-glucanase (GH16 family)
MKPFYIIANMTIGGPASWGGAPASQTQFPAGMEIAYISAWQRYAYLKYLP